MVQVADNNKNKISKIKRAETAKKNEQAKLRMRRMRERLRCEARGEHVAVHRPRSVPASENKWNTHMHVFQLAVETTEPPCKRRKVNRVDTSSAGAGSALSLPTPAAPTVPLPAPVQSWSLPLDSHPAQPSCESFLPPRLRRPADSPLSSAAIPHPPPKSPDQLQGQPEACSSVSLPNLSFHCSLPALNSQAGLPPLQWQQATVPTLVTATW